MVTAATIHLLHPDAIRSAANGERPDDVDPAALAVDNGHADEDLWDEEYRSLLDINDEWFN